MTVCQRWGEWAASLELEEIPDAVLERARLQTRSILAAATAGAEAAAPLAAVAPDGPAGEVYRGAAASIAHDWDDYLYMGHTGHSAVWAARALAADEDRALVAQVAANEVAGRLGAALFLGPHNGQFWASIHCASAATGAGVALGLDAEPLAHGIAIALYQPPYGLLPGFMGPPTKLLTAAEPAAVGVRAALLAAEGMTGPLDVIESPQGLLRHFAYLPRPQMLEALGDVWLTRTLAFKARPGCAYLQAAIDAAARAGVEAEAVEDAAVDAGLLTVAMEGAGRSAPLNAVGVNFSTARSVAVTLLAGELSHRQLAPEWLAEHGSAVAELASRVTVRHDWDMTLEMARGAVDAGASLGDVRLTAVPRLLRRARELAGDGGARRDAWRGLDRRVAGDLWRLLRQARSAAPGLEGLDTAALRMTFPCHLTLRLRSGERIEIDGREDGASGHPLAEQRAVVDAKARAVGLDPEREALPARRIP